MRHPFHGWSRRDVIRFVGVVGAYVLIIVVAFVGFRSLEHSRDDRCSDVQDGRNVLRAVVDVATGPAVGGPVDLTKIGGFDQLDPSTQAYLRNLSATLSQANKPGQPSLHDRLLAQAPPITC